MFSPTIDFWQEGAMIIGVGDALWVSTEKVHQTKPKPCLPTCFGAVRLTFHQILPKGWLIDGGSASFVSYGCEGQLEPRLGICLRSLLLQQFFHEWREREKMARKIEIRLRAWI